MRVLVAVAVLAPFLAVAEGPFEGTWKLKLDSIQFDTRSHVRELKGGVFGCLSCTPPR